jgi:hypothetical protein
VETLAQVNFLDLDDSGVPPADSVDGMHAKPSIADEP